MFETIIVLTQLVLLFHFLLFSCLHDSQGRQHYVLRLLVSLSHLLNLISQKHLEGFLFKLGTNITFDSRMNLIEFVGQ